ncbi:MAG TPA: hypothetical protein VD963_02200 [Phycisphaerales bacterium]|nr:hypothetical protein [Phycisphaerales bacterium]
MPGLEYQHIGHDPRTGPIALWAVDDRGQIREERQPRHEPDLHWLGWAHENVFKEVKIAAAGRVDLDRQAGSIHLTDPGLGLSDQRLVRLIDTLDRRYPKTRWFLFGAGFHGENVMAALARRVLGAGAPAASTGPTA